MEIQDIETIQDDDVLDIPLRVRNFDEQLKILKALASKTRLRIIKELRARRNEPEGGLDISSLAYLLEQTEANISAQCKRLEECNLLKTEYKPGGHGVRKICRVDFNKVEFMFDGL